VKKYGIVHRVNIRFTKTALGSQRFFFAVLAQDKQASDIFMAPGETLEWGKIVL
jgi:hypothetical protein